MAYDELLEVFRGDGLGFTLEFTDDDGLPLDISGATASMTLKAELDSDDTDAAAVVAVDVTSHVNPTGGISYIEGSLAATVPGQLYYLDIQLIMPGARPETFYSSRVLVNGDVTRRTP